MAQVTHGNRYTFKAREDRRSAGYALELDYNMAACTVIGLFRNNPHVLAVVQFDDGTEATVEQRQLVDWIEARALNAAHDTLAERGLR